VEWIWCDGGIELVTQATVVPSKQEITSSTANIILQSATCQTLLMQHGKLLQWPVIGKAEFRRLRTSNCQAQGND